MASAGGLTPESPTPRPQVGGPGYDVVARVESTMRRYGMVRRGDAVVVALSGGPDSTCLIDALARTWPSFELTLAVAHVDHGLSPASAEVAARVASSAAATGYEVHVARAPELAGPNLHARARAFRYAFLETVARKVGAASVATGHTLDDRAETTLARLIHGAGTSGLAGIPPARSGRIRPLIDVRRSETRSYCLERGLEFFDDPANVDERFERAVVRSEVLGPIESRFGEGAVRAIATSAERVREDADALDEIAARLHRDLATSSDDGVDIDLEALKGLPRALRRRVLERAVGRVRDRGGGIEAVLDALDSGAEETGKRFAVAGGAEVVIAADAVKLLRRGGR